jgi:capsule polysaccharide export protein KpsE/RkpR
MAVTAMKAKGTVESLREIVQDLLVPELKSLKVSIDSLHHELHSEVAAIRGEMTSLRGEMTSLRGEMATGFDAVRTEMRLRDEKQSQAIQALSDKLGYAIDIRERLAVLEDRSARS